MNTFEMEGFLRGKCLPGDMKVKETNAEYLVRKFSELEQRLIDSERYGRQTDITIDNLELKLAQMAAELASVKQQEPKAWFIRITDEVTVDAREGEKWRGVPLVRIDVETPNHDAFLAEVRAQGVEQLANAWYAIANETDPGISISESSRLKYRRRADDAAEFANDIRQESTQ